MTQPAPQPAASDALSEGAADAFQGALESLEHGAVRSATAVLRRLKAELLGLLAEPTPGALIGTAIGRVLERPDQIFDRDQIAEAVREAQNLAYRRGADTMLATGYRELLPQPLVREDITDNLTDTAQTGLDRARLLAEEDPEAAIGAVGATEGRVGGRVATEVNRASSDELIAMADRTGAAALWQAERNACVYCLERAGGFRAEDGTFPLGPHGAYASKPLSWGLPLVSPPRHPHCRCTVIVGRRGGLEGLATAFAREAARSILQGNKLPSESESVRLGAAEALLARGGAGLPKSVQNRARRGFTEAPKRRKVSTKPRRTEPTRAPVAATPAPVEDSNRGTRANPRQLGVDPATARQRAEEQLRAVVGPDAPLDAMAPVIEANIPGILEDRERDWTDKHDIQSLAEGEYAVSDHWSFRYKEFPAGKDYEANTGLMVATRRDGRLFVVERSPFETVEAAIARLDEFAEKINRDMKGLPEYQQQAARGVALLLGEVKLPGGGVANADAYDKARGLRFFAGGSRYNRGTLVHENGHLAQFERFKDKDTPILGSSERLFLSGDDVRVGDAIQSFGQNLRIVKIEDGRATFDNGETQRLYDDVTYAVTRGESLSWADAIRLDQPLSARYRTELGENPTVGGDFTEPGVSSGHPMMLGGNGVSNYGATHWMEDVAEAFRLWEVQRQFGYILEEIATGKRYTFEQLFPTRARLLEELSKDAHAGHQH